MKKTNKFKLLLSIFAFTFLSSCKKDFLERPPISNISSENAIFDEQSALAVLRGAYARLRTNKIYGENYLLIAEVTSDDVTNADPGGSSEAFDDFTTNSTFGEYQSFWQAVYEGVQRSNNAMELLANTPYLDENTRKEVVGESKFLRAYYNWLLVTVFGEVPLYLSTPKSVDDLYKPQSPINEIYASIEKDLNESIGVLPETRDPANKGRVTKYAAMAMLGKVYLFQQKWTQAKDILGQVISSGKYSLNSNYANNFNITTENGVESLFEIQNQSGLVSITGGIYASDGGVQGTNNFRAVWMTPQGIGVSFGQAIATRDIFNEFEPLDPRLRASIYVFRQDSIWLNTPPVRLPYNYNANAVVKQKPGQPFPNGSYFHIKKGISGTNAWNGSLPGVGSDDGTNIPVIRYADVLLMYAEASAEAGDIADASEKLNLVRARAKLAPFPYTTTYGGHNYPASSIALTMKYAGTPISYSSNLDDFRKALVHERRVELAFEYHRFNDLVRWSKIPNHPGSAFTVFDAKGTPTSKSAEEDKKVINPNFPILFPKPLAEIDKSRNTITQNAPY